MCCFLPLSGFNLENPIDWTVLGCCVDFPMFSAPRIVVFDGWGGDYCRPLRILPGRCKELEAVKKEIAEST